MMKRRLLTTRAIKAVWASIYLLFGGILLVVVATMASEINWAQIIILGGLAIVAFISSRVYPFLYIEADHLVIQRMCFQKKTYKLSVVKDPRKTMGRFDIITQSGDHLPVYDTIYSTGFFMFNRKFRERRLREALKLDGPAQ